jgi:hypothetical protein
MDRGAVVLQGVLNKLRGWFDFLKRATYAREVLVEPGDNGEFTIVLKWATGAEHRKLFSRDYVFGPTSHLGDGASAQLRACDYARALVREVLAARGIA